MEAMTIDMRVEGALTEVLRNGSVVTQLLILQGIDFSNNFAPPNDSEDAVSAYLDSLGNTNKGALGFSVSQLARSHADVVALPTVAIVKYGRKPLGIWSYGYPRRR
ncbi:hypothetical protein GSI_03788 [Ganoderma sinense ZZ0214-1]|uniref:Uncharacterized protein n=1 Tax=Ganoderma sinense ZZ0214-1 TaxID=1077348 RepID=A0A2G8SK07_9APHY|nr:hypothetical protein GSI_03788 [Ganoderma sinense ZZ0214-1]